MPHPLMDDAQRFETNLVTACDLEILTVDVVHSMTRQQLWANGLMTINRKQSVMMATSLNPDTYVLV